MAECEALEAEVRRRFDALKAGTSTPNVSAPDVRNGARLFNRIAWVLHALDGLPALRRRIETLALTPEEATDAYIRLIAGLLGVVFEAADSATDPAISRALVALFHFMQGKEYTGQERALGSTAFASGRIDPARQQQWQHLIEAQNACFKVFHDFSDEAVRAAWQAKQPAEALAVMAQLRQLAAGAAHGSALDPEASPRWYACCTQRIDAMKAVEDLLTANLRSLCEQRIGEARAELRDQQASLSALQRQQDETPPALLGPHLERSILGMVQQQQQRLQAMGDELETARAALAERKIIERAKGLLMATRKISEEEAHKMLRQTAMNQGRRLVDVAGAVLTMSDYL